MKKDINSLLLGFLSLLLLPVFFVLSVFNQYAGLIEETEIYSALVNIYVCIAITLLLINLAIKNIRKSILVTLLLAFIFLFFGTLKNFLGLIHLSSYRFFIPIVIFFIAVSIYYIIKAKKINKLSLYILLLLLIYTGIEIYTLLQRQQKQTASFVFNTVNTKNTYPVYYIVPDCYPSSAYQKEVLETPFNPLDSFLAGHNFHILKKCRSNYTATAFSMSSTFNLDYSLWKEKPKKATTADYNLALQVIKNAPVFDLFDKSGYEINNLSIFQIHNTSPVKKELFLNFTAINLLFYNTAWSCFDRDILPVFFPKRLIQLEARQKKEAKPMLESNKFLNKKIYDSVLNLNLSPGKKHFIYAHFEMPHFPYFYDSTGKEYPDSLVYGKGMITDKSRFKNYIAYTNKKLEHIINSVIEKTKGEAIIILQSDHGFPDITTQQDGYRNYSAFYFPDKNYSMLYDSMSNVNTFRVLFNKYFDQQLPLLPDKTFSLK